jgi:archaellum component FlaF (FlaF/FlaG flagellin family)
MKAMYQKLIDKTKHLTSYSSIIAILLLAAVIITPLFAYAAVANGSAVLSFAEANTAVYQGTAQTLAVTATTNGKQVVGFQLFFNFQGTMPQDIRFIPNPNTSLQVIKSETDLEQKQVRVALGAPLAAPFVPFHADTVFTLGDLAYTAPNQNGSMTISFDPVQTMILEHQSNKDIAKIPGQVSFNFIAQPSPTPSPSPSPTLVPSPTPSPTPTSVPSPSPSPIVKPSPTPTPTVAPSPSPSPSPSSTVKPSPSPVVESDLRASIKLTDDWGSGYCAKVFITNNGTSRTNTWELVVDTQDSVITSNWSANFFRSGSTYRITPKSWDRKIRPGKTMKEVGFCARKTGSNYAPTVISVR